MHLSARLLLIAVSLICIVPVYAQDTAFREPVAAIDQWIEGQMAFEKIPGLSVVIIKDQQLIWSKGYGYADVENKVPMKAETICSICSISKLFTSVAIMQLWEQGKLRLDDSVSMYLPHFKVKQGFESVPITIRGLLTHSAGLPRESDQNYWTYPFNFPTEKEINDRLDDQSTLYPSSREFQYSNLGMALLGQIVAKVSGMPYEQYVQEKILKPIGMVNTRPFMPKELYGSALAKGYSGLSRDGSRRLLPFFQANGIGPAAGFSSTALDLGKFAQWQNRLYKSKTPEVLKQSTLREMQRVHWYDPNGGANNWGLGFVVSQETGRTIVGHGGSCPGYRSSLDLDPKSGIAVVVFSNGAGVSPEKFSDGIYKILDKYASTSASSTTADLSDYAGIYDGTDWGSEAVVIPWKGRLLMFRLPSNDPLASPILPLFKPTGTANEFRFERKDDLPGVPLYFQRDAAGKVSSFTIHGNTTKKVR